MYQDLSYFINKSHERRFNDSVMRMIIVEIKLKSGELNEEAVLPRYFNKGVEYDGEVYEKSAVIKDFMPKKAIEQAKSLIKKGSLICFENKESIMNWIVEETNINRGSVASLWE
jgi:hypothetical protein